MNKYNRGCRELGQVNLDLRREPPTLQGEPPAHILATLSVIAAAVVIGLAAIGAYFFKG